MDIDRALLGRLPTFLSEIQSTETYLKILVDSFKVQSSHAQNSIKSNQKLISLLQQARAKDVSRITEKSLSSIEQELGKLDLVMKDILITRCTQQLVDQGTSLQKSLCTPMNLLVNDLKSASTEYDKTNSKLVSGVVSSDVTLLQGDPKLALKKEDLRIRIEHLIEELKLRYIDYETYKVTYLRQLLDEFVREQLFYHARALEGFSRVGKLLSESLNSAAIPRESYKRLFDFSSISGSPQARVDSVQAMAQNAARLLPADSKLADPAQQQRPASLMTQNASQPSLATGSSPSLLQSQTQRSPHSMPVSVPVPAPYRGVDSKSVSSSSPSSRVALGRGPSIHTPSRDSKMP